MILLLLFLCLMIPVWARPVNLPPVVGQDDIHTVTDEEDLPAIALRYRLAMEHIAFANGLHLDQYVPDVDAGTTLLIPGRHILPTDPPRDGIVLNIPERGLYLFHHGHFEAFYPVAVGRPGFETPRGQFSIIEKVANPSWAPPKWAKLGEAVMPPGPKNPLGDRWIGLSCHGVGIHGTVSPAAIGMDISHGCIRMYPTLIHELYQHVSVGMPVRIEYEPVKIGYDAATHSTCLAVYPDVYHLVDLQRRAHDLVAGLEAHVPASRVAHIVSLQCGSPLSLEADPFIVQVGDHQVASPYPLQRRRGELWLPLSVLQAAGLHVAAGPTVSQGSLTVHVDVRPAPFPTTLPSVLTKDDGSLWLPAYRTPGQTMVPATPILHALGVRYEWHDAASTLWVEPPREENSRRAPEKGSTL